MVTRASWTGKRLLSQKPLARPPNPLGPTRVAANDAVGSERKSEDTPFVPRVLVLGIGNVLHADDGVGVRVIEHLNEMYDFPENVSVIDGGCLGLSLAPILAEADAAIVVDAIRNKGLPGTVYCRPFRGMPLRLLGLESSHDVGLFHAMRCRHLQSNDRLPVVLVGVEPADVHSWSMQLSPQVAENVPRLVELVLEELRRIDVHPVRRLSQKKPDSGLQQER